MEAGPAERSVPTWTAVQGPHAGWTERDDADRQTDRCSGKGVGGRALPLANLCSTGRCVAEPPLRGPTAHELVFATHGQVSWKVARSWLHAQDPSAVSPPSPRCQSFGQKPGTETRYPSLPKYQFLLRSVHKRLARAEPRHLVTPPLIVTPPPAPSVRWKSSCVCVWRLCPSANGDL